jgi:hypothetical protein
MTSTATPGRHGPASDALRIALGIVLSAASIAGAVAEVAAQQSAPRSTHAVKNDRGAPPDLEQRFWACDYAASTRGVGMQEGAACVQIYEDLKKVRFDGDFKAMMAWWERNRSVEHVAIAAAERNAGTRPIAKR